jgi:acyl-CoA synthetase (AMP-forming)/AMP-acid ligase II
MRILTTPAAFIKDPARWLRALSAHQITYAGGPNFCYDLCVDTVDREALADIDLSRWSVALNAAEPVRARTLDRFAAWARPLGFRPEAMHPGYGLAEATLGVTAKPRGSLPVRRAVDPEALRAHRVEPPLPGGPSQELVSSGAPATGWRSWCRSGADGAVRSRAPSCQRSSPGALKKPERR